MTDIGSISYNELTAQLEAGRELALMDVRDKADFVTGHLWRAINVPFSQLELLVHRFVPRVTTPIVLCHASESLTERAALALAHLGYTNIARFKENTSNMTDEDYPMIGGDYVVAHAFGYHIESYYQTPVISAAELNQKLRDNEDVVVIDTRSPSDYKRGSLPNSINVPVEEVVQKVPDLVTDNNTQIVVHCAGITRAALGAQTLINSGITNPVQLLRDGTKGWFLEGQMLYPGSKFFNSMPSPTAGSFAKKTAEQLAAKFSLRYYTPEALKKWLSVNLDRTCYLIDVRSQAEYEKNHFPDALNIPGGELAGMTSDHLATCNARLCLIDDGESARAEISASWMLQLGWRDVILLKDWLILAGLEAGTESQLISEPDFPDLQLLNIKQLKQMLDTTDVAVIDFSTSSEYCEQHIPGAYWALRSTLPESLTFLGEYSSFVITDMDGRIAPFVAQDLKQLTDKKIYVLDSGNAAWIAAGLTTSGGMENRLCVVKDIDPLLVQKPKATKRQITQQFEASIFHRNSLYPKFTVHQPQKFVIPPVP